MTTVFSFEGKHSDLVSEKEIIAGVIAAKEVFAKNQVDPFACQAAKDKIERDELLTKEEALLFLVWDEAEDAAFRAITLGWLIRGDTEINLVVSAEADVAVSLAAAG
ncbi:hypothetical protein MGMO_11c00240 [Methyloglobulus morosus KoM1]|uniref:Uncharacterized protein n=1 Tax=Methyloglobulus morosus KoM1 TaxID=1116472 RepID=V5C5I1_9GAMM|nr:hypothetical protein [Methyloglobulus morosus]ESS73717.1 hypothetical protein MGMO_11c00240 [Methyloglobulus morosus KoM1]